MLSSNDKSFGKIQINVFLGVLWRTKSGKLCFHLSRIKTARDQLFQKSQLGLLHLHNLWGYNYYCGILHNFYISNFCPHLLKNHTLCIQFRCSAFRCGNLTCISFCQLVVKCRFLTAIFELFTTFNNILRKKIKAWFIFVVWWYHHLFRNNNPRILWSIITLVMIFNKIYVIFPEINRKSFDFVR